MDTKTRAERIGAVIAELSKAVIGKDEVTKRIFAAIIAGGHVLIEDVPGLAKTLIARSFADVLALDFRRIQFTPDLLPGDITGSNVFDEGSRTFEFIPGPIFANLLLADEINRASPKTQSALLEAMQERHVTIEGSTRALEPPFLVIATQNPIELEGTYPLPEAQLDRFMMRLSVGYPATADEVEIIRRRRDRKRDDVDLEVILDRAAVRELQSDLEEVYCDESVGEYVVAIVDATRRDRRVEVGGSPRASLALFKLSRAVAMIEGRDFVVPDDVKSVALDVLSHRIVLKPEHWARRTEPADIVRDALASIPVPAPMPAATESE
jgi:MoxR-like ATPase